MLKILELYFKTFAMKLIRSCYEVDKRLIRGCYEIDKSLTKKLCFINELIQSNKFI
jgi:hypothetical protein